MARIGASYAIAAGGYTEGDLDVTGLSPDEIADLIYDRLDLSVSVCHQCAHGISDPEADEITGFSVDGVHYEHRDGHWQEASR